MEVGLIEAVGSYGLIGGAFIIMIGWNIKREQRLLDNLDKLTAQQDKLVSKMDMLSEDQRDIRRFVGMKKEEK